jgi:uncharacterized protein YqhQ
MYPDQNKDLLSRPSFGEAQLPNASATMVLGILSIVVCFVCGIIALAISSKDLQMYRANPENYSLASYNSLKTGRICAIVGLCLQIVGIIIYMIVIAAFISSNPSFRR